MAGSYVGGSAAFSSLFYSQDAAANPGGSGFAGLTKLGGTSKPQEAVGLTPDKEHRRLENEARQAGARDRGFNRRATALSFRSPFPPLWDEWTAEQTQVGFENPGNSCYRNVVFQLLAHSPAIVRWARWYKDRHIPPSFLCELGTDGGECLICMLHNFLASYWDSSMNELDQKFDIFWKEVYEEWCVENECVMEGQQDPGELLMDIYRQLDAALPAVYSDDLPQITDIEATTIQQCQGQGACEDSEEVRSWPRLVVNYGESDLVDIVQNTVSELFTQQSTLPACEKCSGKKVEQAYLIRAPEHLAVQVNRTNDLGIKVQRPIEFSEKLTLAKEWLDPGIKKDGLYDVEYELSAVILHDGANTRTGHYTIIVKGRTGQWTLIDDEIVKSIHFSDFKGLQKNQEHAYLFSYTRVPFHETREKALRYQQIWNPKLSQGGYGSSPYSPAETARNHPTSSSSRGRRTDSDPMDVDEQGIPNPPRPPSPPPVRTYTPAPPPSPPPPVRTYMDRGTQAGVPEGIQPPEFSAWPNPPTAAGPEKRVNLSLENTFQQRIGWLRIQYIEELRDDKRAKKPDIGSHWTFTSGANHATAWQMMQRSRKRDWMRTSKWCLTLLLGKGCRIPMRRKAMKMKTRRREPAEPEEPEEQGG